MKQPKIAVKSKRYNKKIKSMTNCMNIAELLFSRDSQLSETETRVLTETAPTQLSELREAPKQGEGLLREYETS